MKYRNDLMLAYIGMADAYALSAEFVNKNNYPDQLQKCLTFEKYLMNPIFKLTPGCYTDDTEMSVANARVLIKNNYPFTKLQFANQYVLEFKLGGYRKGYAAGFQAFLESINSGEEFLQKIHNNSNKNGAAMRSVPIGVLPKIHDVIETATLQASITHNTDPGLFSARAVALMTHMALYTEYPFAMISQYCRDFLPHEDFKKFGEIFTKSWKGTAVTGSAEYSIAISTVRAVRHLLENCNSLMDILKTLIIWGGDTDSVAAIAWGIASARYQNEVLPRFMPTDLEYGKGYSYLSDLSNSLMAKYDN